MFIARFKTEKLDFLIENFANSIKINISLKLFVKTRYFVIANLVPNTRSKLRLGEI